jgi:hypothetical protein
MGTQKIIDKKYRFKLPPPASLFFGFLFRAHAEQRLDGSIADSKNPFHAKRRLLITK